MGRPKPVDTRSVYERRACPEQTACKVSATAVAVPPLKLIPGKLAMCKWCGELSPDFNKCLRCKRKLPEDCETIDDPALKPKHDSTCNEMAKKSELIPNRSTRKVAASDEPGHMSKDCSKVSECSEEEKTKMSEIYVPKEEDDSKLFESAITSGINFNKFDSMTVRVTGGNSPAAIKSFATAGLRPLLLENISKSGYEVPTPVQKRSLPIIMSGHDLISCAQNGSGKTAAFLLPILHKLMESQADNHAGEMVQAPQCVIITPIRELAMQIKDEARKFSLGSMISCVAAYGGTSVEYQLAQLQKGCNVLIATPGRLMDFVDKGRVSFENLKYLVLDEADRLLYMDFMPDIRRCMDTSSMPAKGERQTLMFSATFPDEIQLIAQEFLTKNYLFVTVGLIGGACTNVIQEFHKATKYEKLELLTEILQFSDSEDKTLVFVQTKKKADLIATHLLGKGLPTRLFQIATTEQLEPGDLTNYGDRFQREREEALYDFRTGAISILVATGGAARGLDIKGVTRVVNYDLPEDIDEYVHRIGRTGRVGNVGKAISFYDAEEDSGFARPLVLILTECGQKVPGWLSKASSNARDDGQKSKGGGNKSIQKSNGGGEKSIKKLMTETDYIAKESVAEDFKNSKIIVNPFLKNHYIDKNGKIFVESLDKALRISKNGDAIFLKNGEHGKMVTNLEKNVTIIGESTNRSMLKLSFEKSIIGDVQFRRLKIKVGFPIHVSEGKICFENCLVRGCSKFYSTCDGSCSKLSFTCDMAYPTSVILRYCFVEVYMSINRASDVLIQSTKFSLKKRLPSDEWGSPKPLTNKQTNEVGLLLQNIERVEIANTIVIREGSDSTLACLRTYLEKQRKNGLIVDEAAIHLVTVHEGTIRDSIFKGFCCGISTQFGSESGPTEVNKVHKICFTGVYNCKLSNMAVCVLLDSRFTSRSIFVLSDVSFQDSLVGVRVSEMCCHNGTVDVLDVKFNNIASPILMPKVLKQDASKVKDGKKNLPSRLEMKNIIFPDEGNQKVSRKKRRDDFISNLMKAGVLDSTVSTHYLEPIFKPKGDWIEIANEKDMEHFTNDYQSDIDNSVD